MKRGLACVVVAVVAGVGVWQLLESGGTMSFVDVASLTGPEKALLRLARQSGGANPTSIEVVGRAGPLQAVVATGDFIAYWASPPPGRQLPRGSVLWAVIDARTDTISGALGVGHNPGARKAALDALG